MIERDGHEIREHIVPLAQVFVVHPPVIVETRIARSLEEQLDEILRVTHREGTEHHRVDETEDCHVRADAEREREHRDRRESRRPAQQPGRAPQIPPRVVQPAEGSGVAMLIGSQRDAAERSARGEARPPQATTRGAGSLPRSAPGARRSPVRTPVQPVPGAAR